MSNIDMRFPEEVLKTATADGYGLDAALAIAVLTSEIQKFDPDQPRDDSGKWTSGGGGRFSSPGVVPQGRGGGSGGGQGRIRNIRGRKYLVRVPYTNQELEQQFHSFEVKYGPMDFHRWLAERGKVYLEIKPKKSASLEAQP